jgi:hypothetical protein
LLSNSTTVPHSTQIMCSWIGPAREPVLVALEALSEVVLLHEPAAHEQVERAVDGGLADPLVPIAQRRSMSSTERCSSDAKTTSAIASRWLVTGRPWSRR